MQSAEQAVGIIVGEHHNMGAEMDKLEKLSMCRAVYTAAEKPEYPQGIKWTKQRKSVYKILWNAAEPLSAAQIYQLACRNQQEEYAPSTVYRILAAFEEQGIAEKTTWMGDGTAVYSLNRGGHTHYAICLECHKRIPLQSCPFSHMHMGSETGDFTITGHKLELYGYCKACQEMRRES